MSRLTGLDPALCFVKAQNVSCAENSSAITESCQSLPGSCCQSLSSVNNQRCCTSRPTTQDEVEVEQTASRTRKSYYQLNSDSNRENISCLDFSLVSETRHCSTTPRRKSHKNEGTLKHLKMEQVKKWSGETCRHEDLHETIQRQRELIGKLISVIVKDRLKDQDDKQFGESELYRDVEKLLKLTKCCNKTNQNYLSESANELQAQTPGRKKRTRTVTNEKKLIKRLKKDRRSPRSVTCIDRTSKPKTSCSSTPHSSKFRPVKISSESLRNEKSEHNRNKVNTDNERNETAVDVVCRQRALNLMQPDGDSRLFSLRLEFSRQLKSLEDDFKESYNEIQHQKLAAIPKPSLKQSNPVTDKNICAGDSEWSPSSMTSSCGTEENLTSFSSKPSSELCLSRRKKLVKRKKKTTTKNEERTSKSHRFDTLKKKKSTCSTPVATRHASDVALQKIDRLLRHSESDDVGPSNENHEKSFEERALEKIHQSRALWRKLSLDMSAFLFTEKMTNYRTSFLGKDALHQDLANSSSSTKECEKTTGSVHTSHSEGGAKLPSNTADPSFMVSKFLGFLPEALTDNQHGEVGECDKLDPSQPLSNISNQSNDGHSFSDADEKKSLSDIFRHLDTVVSETSRHNSSLICLNFDDDEICDPHVIGEVVVVTTEDHVTENCSSDWLYGCKDDCAFSSHEIGDRFCKRNSSEQVGDDEEVARLCSVSNRRLGSDSQKRDSSLLIQQFRPLSPNVDKPVTIVKKQPTSRDCHEEHTAPYPSATSACTSREINFSSEESKFEFLQHQVFISDIVKDNDCIIQTDAGYADETDDLVDSPVFDETDKTLARPLKNLISDVTLDGQKQNKANVLEWGLVPRKAMDVAKQRIQEQLCGEKMTPVVTSDVIKPRTLRRRSLRNHSQMTNSDDGKNTSLMKTRSVTRHRKPQQPPDDSRESPIESDDKTRTSSESDLPPVSWLQKSKSTLKTTI